MAAKMDRRIRKTKSQLRQGLAKLLKEKTIKEITVKELVEEVDINRSTFYLHYTDIYDLLEQTENDLKNEILEIINAGQTIKNEDTIPHIAELFTFISDNRAIASALLGPNGDVAFMRQIEQIISSHCMNYLKPYLIELNAQTLERVNAFCITGTVGLIINWMKHDFDDTAEEMAKMSYTLVLSALKPYMIKENIAD